MFLGAQWVGFVLYVLMFMITGFVFYVFMFMGGLCVICVNVYGRRSGGLALVLGDCLLPGDPRVLALLCCLYFERSLNFIFHDTVSTGYYPGTSSHFLPK